MSAFPEPPPLPRLTFRLPASLVLLAPVGRHQPCIHGCVLRVERGGLVTIDGPDRKQVIDQAQLFLKVLAKGRYVRDSIPVAISGPWGRDSGWITIEAGILFSWGPVAPIAGSAETGDAA